MVKKPKTPTNEEIWVSLRTLADEILVDDPDRVFLKDGLSMRLLTLSNELHRSMSVYGNEVPPGIKMSWRPAH